MPRYTFSPSCLSRRHFLRSMPVVAIVPAMSPLVPSTSSLLQRAEGSSQRLRVTAMETIVVRATARTTWIFVRLTTNQGLTGLGEASLGRRTELAELGPFFELVRNESPFQIEQYRQRGRVRAASGARADATAFSAIEQALWDLVGKALGAPVSDLFGGRLRDQLSVYANINRATGNRQPEGFSASALAAVEEGFGAIKAAPFDGFPALTQPETAVDAATDLGIACVSAMRDSVGPVVDIKIDAHSNFDVALSIEVARRLQPYRLSWYEEPIPPQRVAETAEIRDAIDQRMAGGEFLFGIEGFAPLCEQRAVDVIMPDVKHCGGLAEARQIATIADLHGVSVSPHNPSGPVSTAASVQLCASMSNFDILEFQWGEVPWRGELLDPPERFENGAIRVPNAPGFGVSLNEALAREHA